MKVEYCLTTFLNVTETWYDFLILASGVVKEFEGDLTFCGCDGPSGCAVGVICESCDCDSCGCGVIFRVPSAFDFDGSVVNFCDFNFHCVCQGSDGLYEVTFCDGGVYFFWG